MTDRLAVAVCLATLLAMLPGCEKPDPIRHYTVPKQEAIDRLAGGSADTQTPGGDMASAEPSRMLAAAVLRPRQAWFFKLVGPDEAVAAQEPAFRGFLQSLRFGEADGPPDWTLPETWSQQPGTALRYATLEIAGEPPLEVSVTTLGREDGGDAAYLLANINRWRGQLGLADLSAGQLDQQTESIVIEGGTATLVNLVGRMKPGGPMMPGAAPFAAGATDKPKGPSPLDHANPRQAPTGESELHYEVPEGWTEEPARGIRKASFQITDDGHQAEVTVIDLDAAAGALLPNVNRWRGQIGLGPTTQDELDREGQPIDVGTQKGTYMAMVGPSKTTLAVVVEVAGRAWFITLKGDNVLAEREAERFKSFVRSLSISGT